MSGFADRLPPLLGAGVAAYLIGSVPFGLLLARLFGAGDIRAIGSGNIGATNVLRTGRRGLAAATLLLDALKGAVAVLLAALLLPLLLPGVAAVAAVCVVAGHCHPGLAAVPRRQGGGDRARRGAGAGLAGRTGLLPGLAAGGAGQPDVVGGCAGQLRSAEPAAAGVRGR